MTQDVLKARLAQCFCATFPNLKADEAETADMDSVEAWDSLASVNLLVAVEEEFGLTIPPDEYDHLSSFSGFYEVLLNAKA